MDNIMMGERVTGPGVRRWQIEERFSPRTAESMMHGYDSPLQAAWELIDNAVDNRKEDGSPLTIRIRITRTELNIVNTGGEGMGEAGLSDYFFWGESGDVRPVRRIGQYGVGGKAAAGYLGRGLEITCSADGSQEEHHVDVPNWESRQGELLTLNVETRKTDGNEGYFRLRVKDLKRQISVDALIERLGRVYRPLLLERIVRVAVNNKPVLPMKIPYLQDDPDLGPKLYSVDTRYEGRQIPLYVGVLPAPVPGLKPGLILYYRGREICDGQLFGMPTPAQMPGMARFIGEAHLDFVPVTTTKSGFDIGSPDWKEAAIRLEAALKTWVSKVAKLKLETTSPIEKYERDMARDAKRVVDAVLASTGVLTKSMVPGLKGEASGRILPRIKHEPSSSTGRPGGSGPKEGQTAPSMEATVGAMPRWSPFHEYVVRSLGSGGNSSSVVTDGGHTILVINSDFSAYRYAKKKGYLPFYVTVTALHQVARIKINIDKKGTEEYLELLDSLIREAGVKYDIEAVKQEALTVKRAERVRKRISLPA